MGTLAGIAELARLPGWRRWVVTSFLSRLPVTMTLLALVLAGQERTGSLAVGAQLAGVATIVNGAAAPWRGRQLDRRELRAGLQRACVGTGMVFLAQAAALTIHAPVWVLFALAVLQGFAYAAVPGGYRAMLPKVLSAGGGPLGGSGGSSAGGGPLGGSGGSSAGGGPLGGSGGFAAAAPRQLARANTLDAVFVEVAFVSGPALAGTIALAAGARGALVAMAGSMAAAALVAAPLPPLEPAASRHPGALWRLPGVRPVFALAFVLGVCVGIVQASFPAFIGRFGLAPAVTGPLLALMAVGSGVGGIVASNRQAGLTGTAQECRASALRLLPALGGMLLILPFAGTVPLLVVALLCSGAPLAPLNALAMLRLYSTVPPGRRAQGFSVLGAAILVGIGLGSGFTGRLLDPLGPRALLAAAGAIPLCATAVLLARGHRGRPGSSA